MKIRFFYTFSLILAAFILAIWFGLTQSTLSVIAQAPVESETTSPYSPQSHTILQPDGTNDVVGEGEDFASSVLSDPWDMTTISDIYDEQSYNVTSSAGTDRWAIEGGVLTATSTTNDPALFLLYPGYENAEIPSVGRYGINTPIDASKYTRLTVRMYLSQVGPSDRGQVIWYADSWLGAPGHDWGGSEFFTLQPGWHTYKIDLATLGRREGTLDWAGLIQGLRLDPTSANGVQMKIDWVRLTTPNTPTTTYPIQFSGSNGILYLYSDTDTNWANGHASAIGGSIPLSSTNTFNWGAVGLPAGDYYVAGRAGNDFANLALSNPWDMKSAADIALFSPDAASPIFSSGVLSFTSSGADPYVRLNWDSGALIDTSVFTRLTFRMYASETTGFLVGWWNTEDIFDGTGGNQADAGWKIYTVDLAADPGWTGQVKSIRIKTANKAGVESRLDWVALTPGNVPPTGEAQLAVDTVYSPGRLTINRAPILSLTKPSMTSGEDYATTELGNPWDMDSLADIDATNLKNISLSAGVLSADTPSAADGALGDSQITLHTGGVNTRTPINADKYKYLTYRFKLDGLNGSGIQDTVFGWVTRVLWWRERVDVDRFTIRDIVVNEDWQTYQFDLTTMEPELKDEATIGLPDSAWQGTKTVFRFDPDEITATTKIHLDWLLLTAPDAADQSFEIQWDAPANYPTQNGDVVDLYYDTDRDPTTKTSIATNIPAADGRYTWNTAGITEGTYFIYLVARDSYNSSGRYSQTPVIVNRAAAMTLSEPNGTGDTTGMGADYATNELVDAWDMEQSMDIVFNDGMTPPIFANGILSATSTNENPRMRFNIDPGSRIDASQYSVASFRLYVAKEGQGQLLWFVDTDGNGEFEAYNTDPFVVHQGWHEYHIDLSQYPKWTGNVEILRLDPLRTSGVNFQLDWIKLTAPNSAAFNINWTVQNPVGAKIALYYDTDASGYDGVLIQDGIDGAKTNYTWDISHLDNGTYYVYSVIDNGVNPKSRVYASGPVTVLKPSAAIGQPDGASDTISLGADFASNVLRDPWDMTAASDVATQADGNAFDSKDLNIQFKDGILEAMATGDDPFFWLANRSDGLIDTTKYDKLYLRLYSDKEGQWTVGWYAAGNGGNPDAFYTSPPQVKKAGWHTYILDMRSLPNWTSLGQVRALRIKPAIKENVNTKVDWVKLVATASSTYSVEWTPQNLGGAKVALYYDTDNSGYDGEQIVGGLSASTERSATTTYLWDTSALDAGVYSIYYKAGAGVNETRGYAAGPVTVLKPAAVLNQPDGTEDAIQLGSDFASDVLADAWDMAEASDLAQGDATYASKDLAIQVTNGIMTGTTTGADPYFWLNNSGDGLIDTTRYTRLVLRLFSSKSGQWRMSWYKADANGNPQTFYASAPQDKKIGWHTYVLDLTKIPDWASSGRVRALRIKPAIDSGVTVGVDWVKLVAPNSAQYALAWTPQNLGGAAMGLYYDTDNQGYDGQLIVSGLDKNQTSYQWDASTLDVGDYYIYANAGAGINETQSYANGPLTILQPRAVVSQPDGVNDQINKGDEFAANVLGDPWDMSETGDIGGVFGVSNQMNLSFSGGMLQGTTTGGDPYFWLNSSADALINPARYTQLQIRLYSDRANQWTVGWYQSNGVGTPTTFLQADPQSTRSGWHTYILDLGGLAGWSSASHIRALRIKPAVDSGVQVKVDWIRLVAPGSSQYTIRWNPQNAGPNSTVSLYSDNNNQGYDGALIKSGIRAADGSYLWDTSAMPGGVYYIYAIIGAGVNAGRSYSTGPLNIRKPGVEMLKPDGVSDRLGTGREFSRDVLGDPWEMEQSTDVSSDPVFSPQNITAPTAANGVLNFRTLTDDGYFYLNFNQDRPIDAGVYNRVVVRMYSSVASQWAWWWFDMANGFHAPGDFIKSTKPGWNTYVVDLTTSGEWTGQVKAIRFKPATAANVDIQIDWVRLVQANSASYNLQWRVDAPATTNVALYYDTDSQGANGNLIVSSLSGTTTSYNWDVSHLAAGDYYVYAQSGGGDEVVVDYAPAPVRITANPNPTFEIGPNALTFLVTPGGPIATKQIVLDSRGLASYPWSGVTSGGSWLSITPTSGAVQRVYIDVKVNPSGLALGTHTGRVTVDAGSLGSRQIPITVLVAANPSHLFLPALVR